MEASLGAPGRWPRTELDDEDYPQGGWDTVFLVALLLPFQESLTCGPGRISRPLEPGWVSQNFPEWRPRKPSWVSLAGG